MDKPPSVKRLLWVGSSKRDLLSLPDLVMDLFGFALYLAQQGKKHEQAKPLKGFGSAGVLEIVEAWDRNPIVLFTRCGLRVRCSFCISSKKSRR